MAATFAGALMYSSSQQSLQSVSAVNASASGSIAAPAQQLAPAEPDRPPVAESSTGDEQQQTTAATSASIHEPPTAPDHVSKVQSSSQAERASSSASHSSGQVSARNSIQYAPPPNMPAAPQNGSVAITQSVPAALPIEERTVPPQPGPQVITVQPGTGIRVRLAEALSSDRSHAGDTFRAVINSPLVVNGFVVAPAGANVFGRIANARKAPVLGGRADLTLTLTDITTADGHLVRIATDGVGQAGARSGIINTAKRATGAAMGAVVGALDGAAAGAGISAPIKNDSATNTFFTTNRTVVFSKGTQIVFSLAEPLKVTR